MLTEFFREQERDFRFIQNPIQKSDQILDSLKIYQKKTHRTIFMLIELNNKESITMKAKK